MTASTPLQRRQKLSLAAAFLLFLIWVIWLMYQFATTGHPIVVSQPQMIVAAVIVEADLKANDKQPAATIAVRRVYRGQNFLGLPAGQETPKDLKLAIANLADTRGWTGPGDYILPLRKNK